MESVGQTFKFIHPEDYVRQYIRQWWRTEYTLHFEIGWADPREWRD